MFWGKTPRAMEAKPSTKPETFDLKHYLPQPAKDSVIVDKVAVIKHLLEAHVDNFYSLHPPKASTTNRPAPTSNSIDARTRGTDSFQELQHDDMLVSSWLALDSRTFKSQFPILVETGRERFRYAVIYRLIADKIVDCIDPLGSPRKTFLPTDITYLLANIEVPSGSREAQVFDAVLSQWKALTWHLLKSSMASEDRRKKWDDDREEHITAAIDSLDKDLLPFVEEDQRAKRHEHMQELFREATDLGLLLFSQPASFSFSWLLTSTTGSEARDAKITRSRQSSTEDPKGPPRSSREQFVKFPALLQHTDIDGAPLRRPVCLSQELVEKPFSRQNTQRLNDRELRGVSSLP